MDDENETEKLLHQIARPLRGRIWVCSVCLDVVTSRDPIPMPASCKNCGWVSFESDDAE